jgi:hypothetical protein
MDGWRFALHDVRSGWRRTWRPAVEDELRAKFLTNTGIVRHGPDLADAVLALPATPDVRALMALVSH